MAAGFPITRHWKRRWMPQREPGGSVVALELAFDAAGGRRDDAPSPGKSRADFVLGDLKGTSCEPAFTAFVAERLRAMGYSVAVNDPYQGAYIVQRYGQPEEGRHSPQIEINPPRGGSTWISARWERSTGSRRSGATFRTAGGRACPVDQGAPGRLTAQWLSAPKTDQSISCDSRASAFCAEQASCRLHRGPAAQTQIEAMFGTTARNAAADAALGRQADAVGELPPSRHIARRSASVRSRVRTRRARRRAFSSSESGGVRP